MEMNQQQQIVFTSESQREQYIFKVVERVFDKYKNSYDLSISLQTQMISA